MTDATCATLGVSRIIATKVCPDEGEMMVVHASRDSKRFEGKKRAVDASAKSQSNHPPEMSGPSSVSIALGATTGEDTLSSMRAFVQADPASRLVECAVFVKHALVRPNRYRLEFEMANSFLRCIKHSDSSLEVLDGWKSLDDDSLEPMLNLLKREFCSMKPTPYDPRSSALDTLVSDLVRGIFLANEQMDRHGNGRHDAKSRDLTDDAKSIRSSYWNIPAEGVAEGSRTFLESTRPQSKSFLVELQRRTVDDTAEGYECTCKPQLTHISLTVWQPSQKRPMES